MKDLNQWGNLIESTLQVKDETQANKMTAAAKAASAQADVAAKIEKLRREQEAHEQELLRQKEQLMLEKEKLKLDRDKFEFNKVYELNKLDLERSKLELESKKLTIEANKDAKFDPKALIPLVPALVGLLTVGVNAYNSAEDRKNAKELARKQSEDARYITDHVMRFTEDDIIQMNSLTTIDKLTRRK